MIKPIGHAINEVAMVDDIGVACYLALIQLKIPMFNCRRKSKRVSLKSYFNARWNT